jgi:hypothetical protein
MIRCDGIFGKKCMKRVKDITWLRTTDITFATNDSIVYNNIRRPVSLIIGNIVYGPIHNLIWNKLYEADKKRKNI